jgi:hypothetical protein
MTEITLSLTPADLSWIKELGLVSNRPPRVWMELIITSLPKPFWVMYITSELVTAPAAYC